MKNLVQHTHIISTKNNIQFFCLAFFFVNRSPSLVYWYGLMLGSYLIGFNVFETSWWGQHIDKLKASVCRSRICFSAALFFSLSSSKQQLLKCKLLLKSASCVTTTGIDLTGTYFLIVSSDHISKFVGIQYILNNEINILVLLTYLLFLTIALLIISVSLLRLIYPIRIYVLIILILFIFKSCFYRRSWVC